MLYRIGHLHVSIRLNEGTSDDPIAQVSLQFDGWEWLHGLGMEVKPSAPYRNVSDLLGSKGIENAVCKVHNYSISIYA